MMRRSSRQIVAILAAVFLTAATDGQVIRLRPAATVTSPVVRLSDVAEITAVQDARVQALGGVLLARAPLAGGEGRVTLDRVADRLERLGEDLSALLLTGSRTCVITRAAARARSVDPTATAAEEAADAPATVIPLAQRRTLEEAIRRFLAHRATEHGAALQVAFRPTDRMLVQLTESAGRFEISARSSRTLGTIPLTVVIPVVRGRSQELRLTVEAYLLRQQVVARRALPKEHVLAAEDLRVVSARVVQPDDRIASAVEDVAGSVMTSSLAAGEAVRIDRLKRPALIRRGDVVTVTYHRGSLTVKTVAWASEEASLGDSVKLRSTRRGKETFTAVCTGARAARIDHDRPGSLRSVGAPPGRDGRHG